MSDWARDTALRLVGNCSIDLVQEHKALDDVTDALREAEARERERCAAIADAEAAEAYRNPRAANYRSPELEKMARYTAERIAKLIRAGGNPTTEPRGQNADDS